MQSTHLNSGRRAVPDCGADFVSNLRWQRALVVAPGADARCGHRRTAPHGDGQSNKRGGPPVATPLKTTAGMARSCQASCRTLTPTGQSGVGPIWCRAYQRSPLAVWRASVCRRSRRSCRGPVIEVEMVGAAGFVVRGSERRGDGRKERMRRASKGKTYSPDQQSQVLDLILDKRPPCKTPGPRRALFQQGPGLTHQELDQRSRISGKEREKRGTQSGRRKKE